jgi:hypothetical protein
MVIDILSNMKTLNYSVGMGDLRFVHSRYSNLRRTF